jgi:hypothetical protein
MKLVFVPPFFPEKLKGERSVNGNMERGIERQK